MVEALKTTSIITSCGHNFAQPEAWKEMEEGATFDCPTCGNLEILEIAVEIYTKSNRLENGDWGRVHIALYTQDFHTWMNARDPRWPASGTGTGYIDIEGNTKK